MAEELSATALCYALVDHKIVGSHPELPPARLGSAESYLDEIPDVAAVVAGGSVATTAAIFSRYSDVPTRLHYRVGDDRRAEIFCQDTGPEFGPPQIEEGSHTGFCILALSDGGEIADEITVYGAADSVRLPAGEQDRTYDIVFSNVNTVRHPILREQTAALLRQLDRRRGVFAFRLSGAHDLLAESSEARRALDAVPRTPDICFGNGPEATNLTGEADHHEAIRELVPDSRILILTDGAADIAIRFEDELMRVPVPAVTEVVDVTAAGDHFMGVTMGELSRQAYADWTADSVRQAAAKGLSAAARIIGTTRSRLTATELRTIREGS